jgi:hypothetical protein
MSHDDGQSHDRDGMREQRKQPRRQRRDRSPRCDRMRIAIGAVVLLAGAAGAASVAGAQDSRDVVLHLHRAGDTTSVRGAVVTLDHTLEAGNTDSAGNVQVPDLPDGGHIVEVVAHGYQSFEYNFNTGARIQQPIQFELIPILASDTAKAKGQPTDLTFAGFAARRTKAQGKFFTRAQLDAAAGRPLANVLSTDAGAFIVSGPHGESQLAMRSAASASSPCFAAVVRDGVRIYPFPGATPPNLDKIFPEELSGLELYSQAAAVPAQLHDAAACGVLVLWSRATSKP